MAMSAKDVRFSSDARDRMLRGVDILGHLLSVDAGFAQQIAGATMPECPVPPRH
jgi:hypothetical protein